jgi:hypothetical protein
MIRSIGVKVSLEVGSLLGRLVGGALSPFGHPMTLNGGEGVL